MNNTITVITALSLALLGAGCVAIPAGTQTFRHEYPSHIANSGEPAKTTYSNPQPKIDESAERNVSVSIGLTADITTEQPQVQRFKVVSVEKKKRLAIGLFPESAQLVLNPKGALTPVNICRYDGNHLQVYKYQGNGKYGTKGSNHPGNGAIFGGHVVNGMTLGLVSTPISLFAEIFGPYESDRHFLGSSLQDSSVSWSGISNTYASKDIDLLCKFPMSEREKIGAWTYHEDDTHPHNTFWRAFQFQWFGVYKYCNYFVKDEGVTSRTEAASPRITTRKGDVAGPYSVTLSLPSLGYFRTLTVPDGGSSVAFPLADFANGQETAEGTVRFAASGTASDAKTGEFLALLEGLDFPVIIKLPRPRLGAIPAPAGGNTVAQPVSSQPTTASKGYRVAGVERGANGEMVVRIAVEDASRTFEIDKVVQPEVRRLFREQADPADASRRETVRWTTENDGNVLVYTIGYAE